MHMLKSLKGLFAGLILLASLVGAIGLGSAHFASAATSAARPLAAQSHLVAYARLGNCGGASSAPC